MTLDSAKLECVTITSDGFSARCPCCAVDHGADSTGNHLHVFSSGKFNCVLHTGDKEHNRRIIQLAGVGETGEETYVAPPLPPLVVDKTWNTDVLARLVKDYSYWEKRGISAATMEPFRGGIALTAQMAQRWVIPIFNDADEIIGFTGRALREGMQPKWRHLGKVSKWVWGGVDDIASSGRAILVESPADLLSLREHGINDALCLFGVNISQAVLGKLVELNPHDIVVATNRDEKHTVGQQAAARIAGILSKFWDEGVVRVALPQAPFKDFNEMDKNALDTWSNLLSIDSTPSP